MNRERLAQIRYAFFEDHGSAEHALDLLRAVKAGRSRRNLSRLLRHHEEEEVSEGETWDRDNFDYLLAFFSMVEVAYQSGFLRGRVPPEHASLARKVLAEDAVRRYYQVNYPLLLPQIHLRRIEGQPVTAASVDDHSRAFDTFFSLSQPIETGDTVETFLWFLDGGSREDHDIDDTIEVLGNRREFLEHMAAGPGIDREDQDDEEELPALSASVQGFVTFMRFAVPFAAFLGELDHAPMLQSAMWHYHGYWFDQMSVHMGGEMRRALDSMAGWETGLSKRLRKRHQLATQLKATREIQRAYRLALGRLSSGRYRYRLSEALAETS